MENKTAQLFQRRREEILTAASYIFAQNGFRRTKIDQIAEHLNVGKGTIYRYFKDKKSLFLAVFEQGMDQLRQTMRSNIDPVSNPKNKVATAVRTYFEFFDNHRELIEILMQVRSEFKEDYRRVFLALYRDYIVRIQENLRRGVKIGVFRELDVEKTAEAMSAMLQGLLQSFYIREFKAETVVPNGEKGLLADSNYVETKKTEYAAAEQKELLADSIEAVTALLLKGLLKRDSG